MAVITGDYVLKKVGLMSITCYQHISIKAESKKNKKQKHNNMQV